MLRCPHCAKPIEHPNTVSSRKLRLARRDRGDCMQCGAPLEGDDRAHVRCAPCRHREKVRQALKAATD